MIARKSTSYLYYINTDETKIRLLSKILKFVDKKKLNPKDEHPISGFLLQNNKVIVEKHKDYYLTKYGTEFLKEIYLLNEETYLNYLPDIARMLFNIEKKFIVINTSSSALRGLIQTALKNNLQDKKYIIITRISYPEQLLKWLVENAINESDGFFNRISWVKLDKLHDLDDNTSNVSVGSDDQVRNSSIYDNVREDGRHVCVEGFIAIDNTIVKIRIYMTGRITLTADYPSYGSYILRVGEELERLRHIAGF